MKKWIVATLTLVIAVFIIGYFYSKKGELPKNIVLYESKKLSPVTGSNYKSKNLRIHSGPRFPSVFERKRDGYLFSDNIYVYFGKGSSDKGKIIGRLGDFTIVESKVRPIQTYQAIKNTRTGKIGYFTGKIKIFSKDEQLIEVLKNYGIEFNKIGSTYILSEDNFVVSLGLIDKLKQEIPNLVISPDINYSRVVAK